MRSEIQFEKDPRDAAASYGFKVSWNDFFLEIRTPKIRLAIFNDQYWKDVVFNYLWKALGIGNLNL